MAKLKEIDSIEGLDDAQQIITRTILNKKERFHYSEIEKEIKQELTKRNAEESILNSFWLDNAIKETLEMFVDLVKLNEFNHYYTPINR